MKSHDSIMIILIYISLYNLSLSQTSSFHDILIILHVTNGMVTMVTMVTMVPYYLRQAVASPRRVGPKKEVDRTFLEPLGCNFFGIRSHIIWRNSQSVFKILTSAYFVCWFLDAVFFFFWNVSNLLKWSGQPFADFQRHIVIGWHLWPRNSQVCIRKLIPWVVRDLWFSTKSSGLVWKCTSTPVRRKINISSAQLEVCRILQETKLSADQKITENNYTENPQFDWSIITFFSMKHQF